jgi:hypothetical protein
MASVAMADPACTFLWDANTEPDLAGYRIYFSGSPIYVTDDVTGEVTVNCTFGGSASPNFLAEIPCTANDTSCCTWSKPALSGPGYFFCATAFDTDGFESLPSNEVNNLPPGQLKNFKLTK